MGWYCRIWVCQEIWHNKLWCFIHLKTVTQKHLSQFLQDSSWAITTGLPGAVFTVLYVKCVYSLRFLLFQTCPCLGKSGRQESVNVTARERIIMLKKRKLFIWMSNTGGLGEDLVPESVREGAVWQWIDSAGKVKTVRSQWPSPLSLLSFRAFILGDDVGIIICKNGAHKMGLSCSESCTSQDHLSALIESPGCWAWGQQVAQWARPAHRQRAWIGRGLTMDSLQRREQLERESSSMCQWYETERKYVHRDTTPIFPFRKPG